MTNPHARLTAALAQHQRHEWGQHDGWWECTCDRNQPYTPAHLASVITSLEGVAVVETVQPSGVNGQDNAVWRIPGFYVEQEFNGDVVINDRLGICADELPALAAALLAAADHVDHLARATEGGR